MLLTVFLFFCCRAAGAVERQHRKLAADVRKHGTVVLFASAWIGMRSTTATAKVHQLIVLLRKLRSHHECYAGCSAGVRG